MNRNIPVLKMRIARRAVMGFGRRLMGLPLPGCRRIVGTVLLASSSTVSLCLDLGRSSPWTVCVQLFQQQAATKAKYRRPECWGLELRSYSAL